MVIIFKLHTGIAWENIPLDDTRDMTLEKIVTLYDGKPCYIHWKGDDGKQGVFCGTVKISEYFTSQNIPAMLFTEALTKLRAKGSPILTAVVPTAAVEQIFPGTQLEQFVLFDGGPHEGN